MPALRAQESKGKPLFSFVINADPHIRENRKGEPTGVKKFEILLKTIQSLPEKPDFMLIVGDIIGASKLKKALSDVNFDIPLHVIAGNNDSRKERTILRNMFPNDFKGRDFYYFKHKGCLFIGICNAIPGDHFGHFSSDSIKGKNQCEWLSNQLANNYNKLDHMFIFGHIPPHPQGKDQNMFLAVNEQKYLKELVFKYKPTALFFGHLHRRMRFKIADSQVFVVRSSNWNGGNEQLGFLKVKVYKNRIDTEFIPIETKETQKSIVVPIISKGSPGWKYNTDYPKTEPSKDAQGKAWYQLDYDDTSWQKGKAPLGYGDEPRAIYGTKLPKNGGSYYFRKSFKIKDLPSTNNLILRVASDNAAIVYLNGKLVDRDPIFLSDKFRTDPVGGHEFVYWNREIQVNPSLLKKGRNLFAVALYNDSLSSDAYLDLELAVKKMPIAFLKYPYLQDLGKTKVTVMWETNIPATGYVKWRTAILSNSLYMVTRVLTLKDYEKS